MALIVIFLLNIFWLSNYKDVIEDKATEELTVENTKVDRMSSIVFNSISDIVLGCAKNDAAANAHMDENSKKTVLKLYEDFQNSCEYLLTIYSGYTTGDLIVNDFEPPADFNVTTRSWYTATINSPELCYGVPYIDVITGKTVMSISCPIDKNGKRIGVMSADFEIQKICDVLASSRKYNTINHFIVDNKTDEILMATNSEVVEKKFSATVSGISEKKCLVDGKKCMMLTGTNEETGWKIYTTVEEDEIFGPMRTLCASLFIGSLLIAVILLSLTSARLGTRLSMPIRKTVDFTKKLAEGEGDLSVQIQTKATNEIGDLVLNFNKFINTQRKMITELKNSEQDLRTIGNSLRESSQTSASSIAEIMSNIEGVRHQTEMQKTTFENVINLLQNNMTKITKLDDLIKNEGENIENSSGAIEQMVGNINSVTETVANMTTQFNILAKVANEGKICQDDVNEKVTTMLEQSKILLEANSTISDVAAQTNLLAMNAAIEAAHAGGNVGKGFSVVADEIRKLAENTSRQSEAIGKELQAMSNSISTVVESSGKSQKAFDSVEDKISSTDSLVQEISHAMNEQSAASKQVLESLYNIKENSKVVLNTAQELKIDSSDIQSSLSDLSQVVSTVNGSMDEMAIGAKEINRSAQNISDMASDTQININTLSKLIGKFKVD